MSAASEFLTRVPPSGTSRVASRTSHERLSRRSTTISQTGLRQGAVEAAPARAARLPGGDLLVLLNDVLPGLDVLAIAGCGLASASFCFPAAGGGAVLREVLLGALLGAIMQRDAGLASPTRFHDAGRLVAGVVRRCAGLVAVLLAVSLVTRSAGDLGHGWVLAWSAASSACVLASRLALLGAVRLLQRRGGLREAVALVGHGEAAARLVRHLRRADRTVELVGVFDDRSGAVQGLPALLRLGQARRLDRVIVALSPGQEARLPAVLRDVKSLSAAVALCPLVPLGHLPDAALAGPFDSLPLLPVASRPLQFWGGLAKATTDRVLAGLALLLLSPLLLAIVVAIRLDSPGGALFRQERDGCNGRRFTVLKFRSMRAAPAVPGELRQTVPGDARLTRLGAVLRRTSLDELPQLINVLRGDMSLVGPRPHAVSMRTEDRLCHEVVAEYAQRHRVKPGLTGLAQVSGCRGATATAADLQRRVDLDLAYIETWSFWLDLRIMALTAVKLFASEGAF